MKRLGAVVAALTAGIMPVLLAAGGAVLLGACASCQSTARETAMPVVAAGEFDGVEVDQRAHRLYLADSQTHGVDVVDIASSRPRLIGTIDVAGQPNGLAVAPELHRAYAGLIGGSLAVLDTDKMKLLTTVKVDPLAADLLDYSPQRHRVYVGTGQSGVIVAVDPADGSVKERLAANVPVEQPRYDPADGMLYATSTESGSLLQIDPTSGTVTRTYKFSTVSARSGRAPRVEGECRPNGMAINPARQLALITCTSNVALVNLRSGAFDLMRAVAGGDLVSYDTALDRFTAASPHSELDSVVGVFYGDGRFLGSLPVSPKVHAAGFDDAHGLVYAVGATGLLSFAPAACEPPPEWLTFAGRGSVFVAPLLAAGLFLFFYARRKPRPAAQTWQELQKEDLEAERERMRELEDSIYGPHVE